MGRLNNERFEMRQGQIKYWTSWPWPVKVGEVIYRKLDDQACTIVEKREKLEADGTHSFTYYLDHSISAFTSQRLSEEFYSL